MARAMPFMAPFERAALSICEFCHASATTIAASATVPWWTVAGVIVALFAVLVALFKDELWYWLHRPALDVQLTDSGIPEATLELRLKNTSKRTAAEEATVRVIELEPHPLEAAIGPRSISHIVTVDTLLPRASGETSYGVAPQAEVPLPLLALNDGWTEADPVLAELPWAPRTTMAGEHGDAGLLVLPSANDRKHWSELHPDLAPLMGLPAMIRVEVAAKNVPARVYTVKLRRDPGAPAGQSLPTEPALRRLSFTHELVSGSAPPNRTMHAGNLPRGKTLAEEAAEQKARKPANP